VKRSERAYRWLLRAYPRDFRDEYGDEMSLLFRERTREASVRLWLQVLGDLIFHAPQEHWTSMKQDFRHAFRQLRRTPTLSLTVIATLAVGLGGTTAVFSVVEAVLRAPLPYEASEQLVRFYQEEPAVGTTSRTRLTGPHFKHIRDRTTSFEAVAALTEMSGADFVANGQAQRLRVLQVTGDYFHTLRSNPQLGRTFESSDESGAPLLILSDRLWRTRFGGNPSVIGAVVHVSGAPYTVVGIARAGFEDPIAGEVDAWLPYDLTGNNNEQNYTLTAMGRLRPGVPFERALEELTVLTDSLRKQWPGVRASTLAVRPLKEDLVGASRDTLRMLLVAVSLVLLVACVNVANILLVRAMGRSREFAVRTALGSGSARIVRQILVESLVIATIGGLLGLALSVLGVRALSVLGEDAIPRLAEVRFNATVLTFAILLTVVVAVLVGSVAAIRFARIEPSQALHAQSRSATGTRGSARLRSGLAAAQLALALMLLSGAGVLMLSFPHLLGQHLGFRTERILTFEVALPNVRYDALRRATFQEELARRLERIPGVTRAGGTSQLPAIGTRHAWPVRVESGPLAGTVPKILTGGTDQQAENRVVSGHFFAALDVPVLAGRTFAAEDTAEAPSRAVVSADFARQAFPGLSPADVVGHQISIFGQKSSIIGVVGDVALNPHGAPGATVYRPHSQNAEFMNWTLTQIVATTLQPEQTLTAVQTQVAAIDPELVVYRAEPFDRSRGPRRESRTIRFRVDGHLRGGGGDARGPRVVRRAGVRRATAHTRDRYSCGARRNSRRCPCPRPSSGGRGNWDWCCDRHRRSTRTRSNHRVAPLRDQSVRRTSLDGHRGASDRCGIDRCMGAGPSRRSS
jgi:predicted permease